VGGRGREYQRIRERYEKSVKRKKRRNEQRKRRMRLYTERKKKRPMWSMRE